MSAAPLIFSDCSLDAQEQAVVLHLAKAWNAFLELPPIMESDRGDMAEAIHRAQRIVMARPVARELRKHV